jgi:hypothetical protein
MPPSTGATPRPIPDECATQCQLRVYATEFRAAMPRCTCATPRPTPDHSRYCVSSACIQQPRLSPRHDPPSTASPHSHRKMCSSPHHPAGPPPPPAPRPCPLSGCTPPQDVSADSIAPLHVLPHTYPCATSWAILQLRHPTDAYSATPLPPQDVSADSIAAYVNAQIEPVSRVGRRPGGALTAASTPCTRELRPHACGSQQ